jgi:hypothetical protein
VARARVHRGTGIEAEGWDAFSVISLTRHV